MLPKVVIGSFDKSLLIESYLFDENKMLLIDGSDVKLSEFREWIYSCVGILQNHPDHVAVILNADKLSPECQATLLKPMEELTDSSRLLLVAENESLLLPTVLSRSSVEHVGGRNVSGGYWDEIRKCWSSGPAACIDFVDRIDRSVAIQVMEEVVVKLKGGLGSEINNKRLKVLDIALVCWYEVGQTNVNVKLAIDNFLLSSWRIIKA